MDSRAHKLFLVRLRRGFSGSESLPLCFWLGCSMVLFSGNVWLFETETIRRVIDLYELVQGGSAVGALLCALASNRTSFIFETAHCARWVMAALSSLCLSLLIGLYGCLSIWPAYLQLWLFLYKIVGFSLGLGMFALFFYAVLPCCRFSPKRSIGRIALGFGFSCLYYFTLVDMPRAVSIPLLCLTLLFIATSLWLIPDEGDASASETPKRNTEAIEPFARGEFVRFLVAVGIYAVSMRFLEPLILSESSQDQIATMNAFVCTFLLAAALLLALFATGTSASFPFENLYSLLAVSVVLSLLATCVLLGKPLAIGAMCLFTVNLVAMLLFCIFTYLICQDSSAIAHILGFGMFAFATGNLLGNEIGEYYCSFGLDDSTKPQCAFVLSAFCLIALFIMFPGRRFSLLLLPIEEKERAPIKQPSPTRNIWIRTAEAVAAEAQLSSREEEVFLLVARGKTYQQIADKLFISPYTVKAHARRIYEKTGTHSRVELSGLVDTRVDTAMNERGISGAPSLNQGGEQS